jgi:citrate lyase subunit beta/citryl-CoA lyase
LPVCDHYCGVEARMVKSLQLQADMIEEFGSCVFDVTLDCEDGAPVGGEVDHANMVVALANRVRTASKLIAINLQQRVGVRLHPVNHSAFDADVEILAGGAGAALSYIMVPKVESVDDVERAVSAVDRAVPHGARPLPIPLHVLIESPTAVHRAFDIAAHPRVESLSFGLMDFVSAHAGAIPSQAMGARKGSDDDGLDQFHHPLVVRAKLEISSACHANGKVPSHCVVTEFRDVGALNAAARAAAQMLGYTRMWSIHPNQIRPILQAFAPSHGEVERAAHIVSAAHAQDWGPISVDGVLHDRASYRYFWQVLERAHRTGAFMPDFVQGYFSIVA